MTQLLEKAFNEAAKLPDTEQDTFAASFLSEMESEARWDELFADSQDILERLADEALEDLKAGRTLLLNPDEL